MPNGRFPELNERLSEPRKRLHAPCDGVLRLELSLGAKQASDSVGKSNERRWRRWLVADRLGRCPS
jgi:hypothetical protein